MIDKNCSLRERKSMETRARLQNSAIDLVTRNGLEKTTVDAISKLANVSPRTFFNYFDSKEDAILGFYKEQEIDNVQDFSVDNNLDVKNCVVEMLLSLFNPIFADRKLHKQIIKLAKKYPQLLERKMSHFSKLNERIIKSVRQIIAAKYPDMDEETVNNVAQVMSIVCVGGIKVVMKEWASTKKELSLEAIKQKTLKLINQSKEIL